MRLTTPLCAKAALFAALFGTTGCGKKAEKVEVPAHIAQFSAMRNPSDAPEAIRAASVAVVRIQSERGARGTGAFISADGLLLTNNHVMGSRLCASDGCFFFINLAYEAGTEYKKIVKVFGKPIFASVDLDVTVLQLQNVDGAGRPSDKFAAPGHLEFESASSSELIGKKVFIVGHPHGGLKKWTEGEAFHDEGKWFYSTNFSLAGNSGSPILNEGGRVVGIYHRGPDRSESITLTGLQTFSINTSSAAILTAYHPGESSLPKDLFLTAAEKPASEKAVADNEEIYFNAHVGSVKLDDGAEKGLIDIVGAACDASLAKETVQSLEELETNLEPCYAAVRWLNCNDTSAGKGYKTCPSDDASKAEWRARFAKVGAKVNAFNGEIPYYWRVDAPAALEGGEALMLTSGKSALTTLVQEMGLKPTFAMAEYAVAYANQGEDPAIGTTTVSAFLRSYDSQPHYEYFVTRIVSGLGWLYYNDIVSKNDLSALYQKLLNDPKISVRDRLFVERYAYQWGVL